MWLLQGLLLPLLLPAGNSCVACHSSRIEAVLVCSLCLRMHQAIIEGDLQLLLPTAVIR